MTVHLAATVRQLRSAVTIIPVRSSWALEHREPSAREIEMRAKAKDLGAARQEIRRRVAERGRR